MDGIGSSYIAWPDLIIVGGAIVLYWCVTTLPPDTISTRVLAVVCGLVIVAIIVVMPVADNLTSSGVHELSFVGIGLAFGLLKWNRERLKSKRTPAPESQRT